MPNIIPITPPRVPLIDPRTGLIDRAWYLFFLSLNNAATNIYDSVDVGPSPESLIAAYDDALRAVNQELQTLPPTVTLPVPDVLTDCCPALVSQVAEMQKQIDALNLLPPPAQGTVTAVTGSGNIASSGGTNPDITFTGTLPTANGGTGLTSFTANGVVYASSASALATGSALAFDGTTLTATGNAIVSDNSANAALRITQIGSGNALLVEDSANPDATPLVVDSGGKIKNGYLTDWSGITAPRIGVDANNSAAFATTSFGYNTAAPIFSSVVGGGTTFGSNTVVSSGQNLGRYRWYGTDGTAPILAAVIEALVDATPGPNDMPGRLVFSTTADGASSPTERLRITSAGAFGLSGANYGTSGQVLTSGGSATAPTWTTPVSVSAPVTKTADFTVANGEIWYINNKSGSTCTVTLPAASSWAGRTLTFKNMQAQTLVSASSNVVPIDSTSAGTAILLAVVGNWATMVSDGTNWVIMQQAANNCLLLE
jgi:hypothetical protein